jgi:hypothetical protein|tara:strand:- start:183 stop:413 length:231 start_codon:yes stop_codon:yes gene_type:complete
MPSAEFLFFSGTSIILSLILGVLIGWVANDFLYDFMHTKRDLPEHPEMYDSNGMVVNEELLTVRFLDEDEVYDDED